MSAASDFDFPMSRPFREGLPTAIDYRTSPTFSGAERRPSTTPQYRDQEFDDLRQQIRGWSATAEYWKERARRAEEELRARARREPHTTFDGPEEPS